MNETIIKTPTKRKTTVLQYLLLLYVVYSTFYDGAARTAGRGERILFFSIATSPSSSGVCPNNIDPALSLAKPSNSGLNY